MLAAEGSYLAQQALLQLEGHFLAAAQQAFAQSAAHPAWAASLVVHFALPQRQLQEVRAIAATAAKETNILRIREISLESVLVREVAPTDVSAGLLRD